MPDPLPQEFKDEVRKEAKQQVAKWVVGGGVALAIFAVTGWIFAVKPYVDVYIKRVSGIDVLASVPEDAVIAFDRSPDNACPIGWTRFQEATSRVIVGAGNRDDFHEEKFSRDENGKKLSPRAYRQHGGEENVALSIAQMPSHDHAQQPFIYLLKRDGKGTTVRIDNTATQPNVATGGHASTVKRGSNQPHNNMPPYVSLYYCKKE